MWVRKLVIVLAALALCCGASAAAPARITVFAAASLQESLDEVVQAWRLRSGQPVGVSYAASSALGRQMEQGAAADVFISANGDWMDYLEQRDLLAASTRFDLVGNRLVLVAPSSKAHR